MYTPAITGTGVFTPDQVITNAELVTAFNAYVDLFNADNAAAIEAGDTMNCCEILLDYYDRLYLKATSRGLREFSHNVKVDEPESSSATQQLIAAADEIYPEHAETS